MDVHEQRPPAHPRTTRAPCCGSPSNKRKRAPFPGPSSVRPSRQALSSVPQAGLFVPVPNTRATRCGVLLEPDVRALRRFVCVVPHRPTLIPSPTLQRCEHSLLVRRATRRRGGTYTPPLHAPHPLPPFSLFPWRLIPPHSLRSPLLTSPLLALPRLAPPLPSSPFLAPPLHSSLLLAPPLPSSPLPGAVTVRGPHR